MQKSKIKIYFDDRPLSQGHAVRGIGYYTRNLYENIKKSQKIEVVENRKNADLVHIPYFDYYLHTLKVDQKPIVVTIYDTIPLIYPNSYPPGYRGKLNFIHQKSQLKKVKAIITISETSKKDIVRFLDMDEHKVYPIHLAAENRFKKLKIGDWQIETQKKYKLPKVFALYVGDVNFNKNILSLVKACKLCKLPLVIVGKQAVQEEFDYFHIENRDLLVLTKEYSQDPEILRLGFVGSDDLVKIYNLATIYCQPSLYEGFGLPILEAQACGIPVVATKIQSLVELAEGSCVFVEDPRNIKEFAIKIEMAVTDKGLRRSIIDAGLTNVKRFSWEKTAKKTIELWEDIHINNL